MVRRWWRRLRRGTHLTLRTIADLPRTLQILVQEVRRFGVRVATFYTIDHAYRLATGAPMERFSRIAPGVHLGGQYTMSGWRRLQRRGVTAVVNLRDEFDNAEVGLAPERYLFLPTVDDTPPTVAQLWQGVRFIDAEIGRGGEVYVHCMLGVGRSATLVLAYFIAGGMSPEAAMARLRRRRPFIQPTPSQEQRLQEFAEEVARIGYRADHAIVPAPEAEC